MQKTVLEKNVYMCKWTNILNFVLYIKLHLHILWYIDESVESTRKIILFFLCFGKIFLWYKILQF